MIRRSAAIATAAILLSLLLHILGLSLVKPGQKQHLTESAPSNEVTMGNSFEDIAETRSEPVQPEPTPPPEPEEVEQTPEPEPAETPTSQALVASANPQRTFAPDTGSARAVQLDTAGPADPLQSGTPEPETLEPSGSTEQPVQDVAVAPPIEAATATEAPEGSPDAGLDIAEVAAEPATAPQPDTTERLAALPAPVAPVPSVAPAPETAEIPVTPPTLDALDPQTPETPIEPVPETVAAEEDKESPLTSSLRPRLPPERPENTPLGQADGAADPSELQRSPPPLMESPLTVYQRSRTDLIGRRSGGTQSGGTGFMESRGPGNSDVTNYVGRVLVHLNRVPPVHVSARGAARVFFEINPDGSLASVDVIQTSGSPEIERAAKQRIRNAVPFPRPPDGKIRRMSFVYRVDR